jgi:hypothetical protein
MIYLVGISHHLQRKCPLTLEEGRPLDVGEPETTARFERYLESLVRELQPAAICEELSSSMIYCNVECIALSVAHRNGMEHLYCDPDRQERQQLYEAHETKEEIDKNNRYPLREDEWLRRLKERWPESLSETNIIFLCGADHVATFGQKLRNAGYCMLVHCADLEECWKLGRA